jgi:F0F1-type ATP synthase assembly protein I
MNTDTIQTLGKYLIAAIVLGGCFFLLYTGDATNTQPWTVIGLIVGWIVRDSAGQSATTNATKTIAAAAASQPTVTTSAGPPATTTVAPADPTVAP